MEWMILDQASFLRELMSKSQRAKTSPFAIISLSNFTKPEKAVLQMAEIFSNQTQRNIVLLGLNESELLNLQYCVEEEKPVAGISKKMSQKTTVIPGPLNFISSLPSRPEHALSLVEHVKVMEQSADTILYYAGQGLQTTTINLAMMTRKVLVLLKPTEASLMELTNYINIFTKTNSTNEVGIILEASSKKQYEEEAKKIQELYWRKHKYYIEPVGYYDVSQLKYGNEAYMELTNTEYMLKKSETTLFSESLAAMFL